MKKLSKVLFASLLALSLLVACGGGKTDGGDATDGGETAGSVKIGVASTQNVKAEDAEAEFGTVVVGVALVDDKVAYIKIDESQQKAELDGEAKIEAAKTKGQKGADYGMLEQSTKDGLGKEWNDQVAGIEKDLVGKNLEEVKAYFAGDDVKSSATIHVGGFEETVVKAIDSAVAVEGVAKVGLGYHVSVGGGEKDAQSVLEYAMVAVDADGKIVKALLDNAQEKATIDGDKFVAADINKTKGELKEAYGMKEHGPADSIGTEWNEQNDALMEALVGKTFAEALELQPKEGDIATTVTIHIDGVQAALKHAEENLVDVK